ncbi:MAG: cysteine desulfurase family protein [Lactimicrobium sp.]|jgi:cysteine desulfurase|uniref:cysteine desulfurase family protein n=1 Tax=Lactimicrobium sp. TaxID=2563780 RepID=UPI002F35967D
MKKPVYFDYCANTPVDPSVLETYVKTASQCVGNANSVHAMGRASKAVMDDVLAKMAALLHVRPDEIILTSGATEANNLALKGIAAATRHVGKHIVSTSLEHSSISASLSMLQMEGYEIDLCPLTSDGTIDLEELADLVRDDTCLVSISLVDSEAGVIQPVKKIAEIVHSHPKTLLHMDATQAMGKIPVDFAIADTVSFAPHKFFGLNGCGVLIKHEHVPLVPQNSGGASTTLYRSGTPDPAMAAACLCALEKMYASLSNWQSHCEKLNAYLRRELTKIEGLKINSPDHAVPQILNISLHGYKGFEMQKALDEKGYCVSVKSACTSDYLPSHAVMALTKDRKRALESFRISLSPLTTMEECQGLAEAIREIHEGK